MDHSVALIFYLSAATLGDFGICEDVDVDLTVDRTDWKDPLDPLTPFLGTQAEDLRNCKDDLRYCLNELHNIRESNIGFDIAQQKIIDPTLKHIVRSILSRLNVDINQVTYVDRSATVYLNADSVRTIRSFLDAKEDSVSQREQIRAVLEDFITQQDSYVERSALIRFTDGLIPYLPLLNLLILLPAVLVLLRLRYSSRSLLSLTMFAAFLASFFTTYNRKYQENVAARIARSQTRIADQCKPKSFFSEALYALGGLFFIKAKSECLQYHEDLFVDPLYEISPLDVLSDVISNFIFTPLGIFGRHFNAFFNEFYRDSPIHLVLIKTIIFIFIIVSALFWTFGYRLRTIFATLEPAGLRYSSAPATYFLPPTNSSSASLSLPEGRGAESGEAEEPLTGNTIDGENPALPDSRTCSQSTAH